MSEPHTSRTPAHRQPTGSACLAGPRVAVDATLIGLLRTNHDVRTVDDTQELLNADLLGDVSVLVLECTGNAQCVLDMLLVLKQAYSRLAVVLVNGGLTDVQIATAFRLGATDYFRWPYDARLLAERVHFLAGRLTTRNAAGNEPQKSTDRQRLAK